MSNSNIDWASQSSLVEDQITVPLPEDQKRKVQMQCLLHSKTKDGEYDQAQALEFMMALGVHPTQATEPEPSGAPVPSPHLSLKARSPGRIDRVDNLNVMQGRR